MKKLLAILILTAIVFLTGCPKKENQPPVVQKASGLEGIVETTTGTFTWSGDDPDGTIKKYECRKDGLIWEDVALQTTYTWNDYTSGAHTFEVRAIDNKNAFSNIVVWNFTSIKQMILVEGGQFTMGDTWGDGYDDETPTHDVTITYDYYIGKYQVTFDEFDAFCDDTERTKPADAGWGRGKRPVIFVSWWDAISYCNWLSERAGLPIAYDGLGNLLDSDGEITLNPSEVVGYRLPTEAEWEYAARGGKSKSPFKYSGGDIAGDVAWYRENSYNENVGRITTWPIGLKTPNVLMIYDMSGNVHEWCSDMYSAYTSQAKTNPFVSVGTERVIRGGSFFSIERLVRVADREKLDPTYKRDGVGFRIAITAE